MNQSRKTDTESADKESIEQIKNSLRNRLQQSGIHNLIRHMVRDVCTARGDTGNIEPEEIVQELYQKGLIKDVLDNIKWSDCLEKEIESRNKQIYNNASTGIVAHDDHCRNNDLKVDDRRREDRTVLDKTKGIPSTGVPDKHQDDYNTLNNSNSECQSNNAVSPESFFDSNANTEDKKNYPTVVEEIVYERKSTGLLNGRYSLKLTFLGGRTFLDQLFDSDCPNERKSSFILHVSYRAQRFYSKPTTCQCDPKFQDTFMIDIGYYENGSVLQLLTDHEPIRILLIQETFSGERKLLSSCSFDWRSLFMSTKCSETIPITLMGIGPEYQVPVGVLNTRLTILPHLQEILSPSTYAAQVNAERSIQDEKERLFLIYIKQWWREFLEIRPQHSKRHVKIFSYDENMIPRPVQTFVKPIPADRMLLTPFHAAWFVSLISLIGNESDENYRMKFPSFSETSTTPQVLCDHWQSLISTITTRTGRVEDHASLLCSLLLGFGLDAYVAIGTKSRGIPWIWVVTLDKNNQATLWESTTGSRYLHFSITTTELIAEKITKLKTNDEHDLHTISCLFNNCLFYANIQQTNLIDVVDWNLLNPSKWKKIPESTLKSNTKFYEAVPQLLPPRKNSINTSMDVEVQLKTLISEIRMKNSLHTHWDNSLAVILGQELAKYEMESCFGMSSLPDFFESAVLKNIPGGYEFKAFVWNCNVEDAHKICQSLMRNSKCREIIKLRGNDIHLAIRVHVFVYPEDVISLRLMLACKFVLAS